MNIKSIVRFTILLLATFGITHQALAKGNVVIVKAGTYTLETQAQRIDAGPTVNAVFDEDGDTYGVEFDHLFKSGVSVGGGYQTYNLNYTSNVGAGDVDASFFLFNSKYHFAKGSFKPFIGASVGFALSDFSGGVTGNTVGLAAGVMAGIRWQFSTVGIYAEYKKLLAADTEDSLDAEVDLAGDSVTAGLSFAF